MKFRKGQRYKRRVPLSYHLIILDSNVAVWSDLPYDKFDPKNVSNLGEWKLINNYYRYTI